MTSQTQRIVNAYTDLMDAQDAAGGETTPATRRAAAAAEGAQRNATTGQNDSALAGVMAAIFDRRR